MTTYATPARRFKRLAFEQRLYHGTSFEAFKGIVSAGMLMAQEVRGAHFGNNYDEYPADVQHAIDEQRKDFDGYVFLTNDLEKALNYALEAPSADTTDEQRPLVVLEFYVPTAALLPDDIDCEDCKTWQASLEAIGQVKVLGNLSLTYLKGVQLYNRVDPRVHVDTTLARWVQDYADHAAWFHSTSTEVPLDYHLVGETVQGQPKQALSDDYVAKLQAAGYDVTVNGVDFYLTNAPLLGVKHVLNARLLFGVFTAQGDILYNLDGGLPGGVDFVVDQNLTVTTYERDVAAHVQDVPALVRNLALVFEPSTVFECHDLNDGSTQVWSYAAFVDTLQAPVARAAQRLRRL